MSLFKRLFKRSTEKKTSADVFENAPHLAPWYFEKHKPLLQRGGKPLSWEYVQELDGIHVGLIKLIDDKNNIYAVIDTYEYILPIQGTTKFLVWNRKLSNHVQGYQVSISLYDSIRLTSLGTDNTLLLKGHEKRELQRISVINGTPIDIFEYTVEERSGSHSTTFPSTFRNIPPFIVITDLPDVTKDLSESLNNTVFFEFIPSENKVNIIPQDWFNKGDLDFGYQWITRAVRDVESKLIYGQGIRIDDFVLDKDGVRLSQ